MKSLKFSKLNIAETDVLSKLQMKKITGGASATLCAGTGTPCGPKDQNYTCSTVWTNDEEECCCGYDEYNDDCIGA
jgi:natural product precursor